MLTNDRPVPSSPEAEKSILGNILACGDLAAFELEGLSEEHFFADGHRRLFRRMAAMAEDGRPVDSVSVMEELASRGELGMVGGAAYLVGLTEGLVRRASLIHHVAILRERWNLRRLILNFEAGIERAIAAGADSQQIVEAANRELLDVATDTAGARDLAIPATEFLARRKAERDWLVEGLIERGSNGFVVAEPKGSKSFWVVGLCDALARGEDFLGFRIRRRVRTLILNAEDNPETTRWRLSGISRHKGFEDELDGWLWVSSKEEFPSFKLDRPSDIRDIVATCRKHAIEFLVLDVLNVLHDADENDNKEMRRVLSAVNTIQSKAGCQICIVHHYNKADGQSVTKRMRGSSAISGFAEWIVGLDMVDEASKLRRAQFEIKGGEAPEPVFYRIENAETGGVRFSVTEAPPQPKKDRRQLQPICN